MLLAKYWTVTTTSVMPWRLRRLRICSMTGLPTMGTMGFGRRIVNGRSLDPSPPAITTALLPLSECTIQDDFYYKFHLTSGEARCRSWSADTAFPCHTCIVLHWPGNSQELLFPIA